MASLKVILLDAKKACGVLVLGAATALAQGLISSATAALITGIATVVTTVVVYALTNIAKP